MRITHATYIVTALLLLSTQAPAMADETVKEYTIKQATPSTGSNFRREIVKAGTIPLDKSYADLTPQEKAAVKSQYEHMGDADEPPFPINGLRPLYVALAQAHEQYNLQYKGELLIYVNVDSTGKATSISIAKSPNPELSQSVANFMDLAKFKPASCNGKPCAQAFAFHAELIGPDSALTSTANAKNGVEAVKSYAPPK
ncbi:MAG TPA: energy transducer TonB [Burkholderiaceae bacterium]|jgi:outer membrane biosynthesis protein TonB